MTRLQKTDFAGDGAVSLIAWGAGILTGIILVAFLPGMPWSIAIEPRDASTAEALDLAAQRSMASAAWYMVVITFGSGVVAAASLWLIAKTLYEARRSADAAIEGVRQAEISAGAARLSAETAAHSVNTQKAQTRGYLSIESAEFIAVSETPDDGQLLCRVGIKVKNVGITPLKDIQLTTRLLVSSYNAADESQSRMVMDREQARPTPYLRPEQEIMVQAYFLRETGETDLVARANQLGGLTIAAYLTATSKDIFGDLAIEKAAFITPLNPFFEPRLGDMQRVPSSHG